ncbi:uncharacterized protein BDV14DRAFT_204762 [Aspergillus stella-maris]|uniref:uncharacterized protein n=1 Tax=Aspergillus stella-maris TaxID=1810926 RepID=UPI003CCDEA3E
MTSFLINGHFPPIPTSPPGDITPTERSTAIDFVNRHNFIFAEFTHSKMLDTFLSDAVVYHSHGTIRGHAEMKKFFEEVYGFFIPGIVRSATNHVVDRDEEGGVIVRYLETLIRYGWEGDGKGDVVTGRDVVRHDGLPKIWWVGTMIDRLRITENGWKVYERYLGAPVRDGRLDLPRKSS